MDSVKELFASALPSWPSEKLDAAMKHLAENMGVEGPGCLEYMNVEEDLKAILKPIEARKVVRFLASFLQSPGDDVFNGDCCFVVIDKHALESCDFGTAVAALFATYYVFNVSYPGTSVNTLEFVQRALADINPARGTKSSKSKKSAVPPAVLRLLAELLTID